MAAEGALLCDLRAAVAPLPPAPRAELEQWEPLTPWCLLVTGKVKKFQRRVNPEALSVLAELFLTNGDMCAWLYTGSQVRRWHVAVHRVHVAVHRVHVAVHRVAGAARASLRACMLACGMCTCARTATGRALAGQRRDVSSR